MISISLSKYLAKVYLGWLVGVTSILTLLVVVLNYIELFRRAETKAHITFSKVSLMVMLQLPDLLEQIFPFCVLFSTLLLFWKLNRHGEMVVIKSLGQSIWKLVLPLVAIIMVYSCLSLSVINPLSAAFLNRSEQLDNQLFRGNKNMLTIGKTGLWFKQVSPGGDDYAIVRIAKVGADGKKLEHITIYNSNQHHHFLSRIDAKMAYVKSGGFELCDVVEAHRDQVPHSMDTYFWHTDLTLSKIEGSFASPSTISFWELPRFIEEIEEAGFSANEHKLYWYEVLCRPLLLISMILLASFYGVRAFHRHQSGLWFVTAGIGIAFGMYLLQKIFYALGQNMVFPPFLAVVAPMALSILLGLSLILHFEDK
jgi:lipopolysaccharide export system permease protein